MTSTREGEEVWDIEVGKDEGVEFGGQG